MSSTPSHEGDRRRPNVIWIFGDQHRACSLGVAGDPNLHTPNLDRLAHNGVWFRNAVGGFPLCCPYRGALLSGRYPQHNGVIGHEYQMNPELPTVAAPFRDAGYRTSYFGKWHVDGWHERDGRGGLHIVPRERRGGFDDWIGYENNNAQWDCYVHGHRGDEDVEQYRLPCYETDELTNLLLGHVDEMAAADQPFFAVLSVQPPHDPYVAPEPWMQRHSPGTVRFRPNVPDVPHVRERAAYELAGYHAMIENLDWNVGRVMSKLAESGLADDTWIVFFSDHGDMHGSHGQFRKTTPLQESLNVPCIIAGPPRYDLAAGSRPGQPMNHMDLGPTSLGLCGLDVPDWMAGADYAPLCRRPHRRPEGFSVDQLPDSAYLQAIVPTGHGDSVDRPWRGVMTADNWKYLCLEGVPWLMFDLNTDPYEQVNLAHNSRYRQQRRRLQERLAQWIEQTGDAFPLPEV